MIDEQKLREKLEKILENPHIHSFAVNGFVNSIIKAVKECEEEASVKSKIKRTLKRK